MDDSDFGNAIEALFKASNNEGTEKKNGKRKKKEIDRKKENENIEKTKRRER